VLIEIRHAVEVIAKYGLADAVLYVDPAMTERYNRAKDQLHNSVAS
jgi:hypothetical protein